MTYCFARGKFERAEANATRIIDQSLLKELACIRCHARYKEAQNIGRWYCAMHTLKFDTSKGYYPCCKSTGLGCKVCDHTSDLLNPYPTSDFYREVTGGVISYKITKECMEDILPVLPESVRLDPNDKTVVYILRRQPF